ncbi:hypothetical protein [Criibacterium bergeronii]|nr:hypothetical protein [Criibacterium bergeronii]
MGMNDIAKKLFENNIRVNISQCALNPLVRSIGYRNIDLMEYFMHKIPKAVTKTYSSPFFNNATAKYFAEQTEDKELIAAYNKITY